MQIKQFIKTHLVITTRKGSPSPDVSFFIYKDISRKDSGSMIKICEYCGKEFNVRPAEYERRKCCSKECLTKLKTTKVKVNCRWCNKELLVIKSKEHKNNFCDLDCLGKWNGERNKKRIIKICEICEKEFEVIQSREDTAVTCSVECQNKWQSLNRTKENSTNWQGGGGYINCLNCGKEFYVDKYRYDHEITKYCSLECKQEYWSNNIQNSEDFREKQRIGNAKQWENPEFREKIHQTILNTLASYPRETSIEKKVREWLEDNNINHKCQHIINDKFCVDFYLPNYNIIIETFGDYWHSNPLKFGEGKCPLNDIQIKNKKMDKSRIAYLTKCGYSLFILWETNINNNLEETMKSIKEICIRPLETDISVSL